MSIDSKKDLKFVENIYKKFDDNFLIETNKVLKKLIKKFMNISPIIICDHNKRNFSKIYHYKSKPNYEKIFA